MLAIDRLVLICPTRGARGANPVVGHRALPAALNLVLIGRARGGTIDANPVVGHRILPTALDLVLIARALGSARGARPVVVLGGPGVRVVRLRTAAALGLIMITAAFQRAALA